MDPVSIFYVLELMLKLLNGECHVKVKPVCVRLWFMNKRANMRHLWKRRRNRDRGIESERAREGESVG